MSDTARPKTAGDKLSADEVNNDLPIPMTAGETINGATLPVAIYVYDTDDEIYACDANDQAKLNFIGFAITNSTDGNGITIQTKGTVSGFTGLDTGKKYYVQDDKTIGTTIGTYEVLVGIAISATQLLILKGYDEFMGSASVDTDGSTTTVVPAGCKKIITIAYKAKSGNATTGEGPGGGQTISQKGFSTVSIVMGYGGSSGGGPYVRIDTLKVDWTPGGATMTAYAYRVYNATDSETEQTGYTITAYFYKR